MIWITLLFGCLSLLLQWLMSRKDAGTPLSEREQRKVNHALSQMAQIRSVAGEMGMNPEGKPDQEFAQPVGADEVGLPGQDFIIRKIIDAYALPPIRNIVNDLQSRIFGLPVKFNYDEDGMREYLVEQFNK